MEWQRLTLVCSSEVLRFEETVAAAVEALEVTQQSNSQQQSRNRSPSPQVSPRGGRPKIALGA